MSRRDKIMNFFYNSALHTCKNQYFQNKLRKSYGVFRNKSLYLQCLISSTKHYETRNYQFK